MVVLKYLGLLLHSRGAAALHLSGESISQVTVYTVGHSTHNFEEFVTLIKTYGISMVVDVRAVPLSRHNPQFNKDALANRLKEAGLRYVHLPEVGGLRRASPDSVNLALDKGLRGYGDYMQTKEFNENLLKLIALIRANCVAVMCAEAVPWKCHRSLLSDALLVHRIQVKHILTEISCTNHELTQFAHVEGTKITYPLYPEDKPQKTLFDF
jgi:uncharacterized protein (DUF488 family)